MIIRKAHRLKQVEEYYFSKKLQQIRKMIACGDDVINLGIGSPDLAPDPLVIDALHQSAVQEGNHGYQPYRGIQQLRLAMGRWYKEQYGVQLDADVEILPLMGSKEGIFHISMAFLNEGDEVLIPDPGYPGYAGTTRLVGAVPRFYALDPNNHWQPAWDELEKMDTERVKIMWINYPHMPTGACASLHTLERLVDWCIGRKILLCHDNPYSLILNPQPPVSLHQIPAARESALELNSLSKGHNMAGWRVGLVTGNSQYIDALVQVKSNIDSGMFKAVQEAAIQALGLGPSWHDQLNEVYQRRRALVHQLMDQLECRYDPETAGLFVWAQVPSQVEDTLEYTEKILQEAKVFIVPGEVFGRGGRRYVRCSLCVPEARIQEAIGRIIELKKVIKT